MKNTLFVIGIMSMMLLASCSTTKSVSSLEKQLKWLEGEWVGEGYQSDALTQATWPIDLKINLDNKSCKINYPSLDCGGEWKLITANHHSATFTEVIITGQNRCYNGGKLIITLVDENHLSYSFFYPDSGQLGAYSTLIRKEVNDKKNATTL